MPYEYRKLTQKERDDLVAHRVAMGFPPHAPPHPFRDSAYYMFTAANYEHAHVMKSADRRTDFQTRLLLAFQEIKADVSAWVVLANHYHILARVESLSSVSDVLRLLHGSTSFNWNREDDLSGNRKVWYKYSDRMIRGNEHYFRALNYIHYNPVKHGYAESAYDWEWSSLVMYQEDHGREWLGEQWRNFPPQKEYGEGWDEM
jgi:putative transposase